MNKAWACNWLSWSHDLIKESKMANCGLVLFVCLVSFLIDFSAAADCKVSGKACQATCNGKKYDLKYVTKSE